MQDRLPAGHGGLRRTGLLLQGHPPFPGLGSGSGFSIMLQDQGGNEPTYLGTAGRFMQAAMQRPEISQHLSPYNAGVPQRYLDIDKEKAMKLGVPLNSIYSTVGSFREAPT